MSLPFKIYFRFGADILLLPTLSLYHIVIVEFSFSRFLRFPIYPKHVRKICDIDIVHRSSAVQQVALSVQQVAV